MPESFGELFERYQRAYAARWRDAGAYATHSWAYAGSAVNQGESMKINREKAVQQLQERVITLTALRDKEKAERPKRLLQKLQTIINRHQAKITHYRAMMAKLKKNPSPATLDLISDELDVARGSYKYDTDIDQARYFLRALELQSDAVEIDVGNGGIMSGLWALLTGSPEHRRYIER